MKLLTATAFGIILICGGCKPDKKPSEGEPWQSRPVLETQMQEKVQFFRLKDPTIRKFLDDCYGLIVSSSIYKAPTASGGVFGRCEVYERGNIVGSASVSIETARFDVPGDYFRQIVFFKNKADFEAFKAHGLIFGPEVVGIAIDDGIAAKSEYINGMAVFLMTDTGQMSNASLAGEEFKFAPTPQ